MWNRISSLLKRRQRLPLEATKTQSSTPPTLRSENSAIDVCALSGSFLCMLHGCRAGKAKSVSSLERYHSSTGMKSPEDSPMHSRGPGVHLLAQSAGSRKSAGARIAAAAPAPRRPGSGEDCCHDRCVCPSVVLLRTWLPADVTNFLRTTSPIS